MLNETVEDGDVAAASADADTAAYARVCRCAEAALEDLDIAYFLERYPPLLHAYSQFSRRARGALRGPGRHKVAWLRINNLKGDVRDADRNRLTIDEVIAAAPAALVDEVRQGTRRLILDYSHEGRPADEETFAALEKTLRKLSIKPRNTVLLTQNPKAKDLADARHAQTGRGLHVVVAHMHLLQLWNHMTSHDTEYDMPEVGFAAQPGESRPYAYISLNFTIRGLRAILVGRLRSRAEEGLLSFSTERSRSDKSMQKVMNEVAQISLPGARDANRSLVKRLFDDRFEADIDTGSLAGPKANVYQLPTAALRQANLFLVTETEMADPSLHRFTEKTIKAIIAGLPFVIFGNQGTIAELRAIGFDVFDGLVDHGYNAVADPAERFEAAWLESARLLDSGPDLVERHRERIDAANARNAAVFRDGLVARWIERPLEEIVAWASRRTMR